MKMLELAGGGHMPAFGLGTWKAQKGEVGAAIREAIRIGYRHVDCAPVYQNEPEIGEALTDAIAAGDATRDDLFITSKLWNSEHAPADVATALERTLRDLRLDHLDLYLIHWPVPLKPGTMFPQTGDDFLPADAEQLATTWSAMEALVERGLVRNIGLSNFGIRKIDGILRSATVRPAANQVELHPYLAQPELLEHCRQNGIVLTAYSPLGSPDRPDFFRKPDDPVLLEDPALVEVAARNGISPAQAAITWAVQRGTSLVVKSTSPERLRLNLIAAELSLSDADMQTIDALDRGRRYIDGAIWMLDGSPHTPANLWA